MYRCENCEKLFDEPDIRTETWSDPGVYPSGAGGYPLSSYDYEIECCPYCESDEFYEKEDDEDDEEYESEELD